MNQIFKDLATMVHEQGEVIDSIEANVEMAQQNVSQGATELRKARQSQVKTNAFFLSVEAILRCQFLALHFKGQFIGKPLELMHGYCKIILHTCCNPSWSWLK